MKRRNATVHVGYTWEPELAENARDHERRFRRWLARHPEEQKRIEALCFEVAADWQNDSHGEAHPYRHKITGQYYAAQAGKPASLDAQVAAV